MKYRTILGFVWIVGLLSISQIDIAQSCQTSESTDVELVSFPTSDGGKIFGSLYGTGDHAVVLAHGAVFDKESWSDQSVHLSKLGFRVLAIDFRGYGKSKSGSRDNALHLDVLAAVRYLHEQGAKRVSVVVDTPAKIYCGSGYGGQHPYVVPEYDLVVVFNAWNIHNRTELSAQRAVVDRILPAIKKSR